uniref:Uncharacterized protein n=1 Tax=Anguilla anguilla TaxID=7936 RepID=A0A0E9X540_ANGAN
MFLIYRYRHNPWIIINQLAPISVPSFVNMLCYIFTLNGYLLSQPCLSFQVYCNRDKKLLLSHFVHKPEELHQLSNMLLTTDITMPAMIGGCPQGPRK